MAATTAAWRKPSAPTIALVLMLGLTACAPDRDDALGATSGSPTSATSAPDHATTPVETFAPNGETLDVLSLDNNFILQHVTVEAGTEVRWTNNGRNDHNVLPADDPEATVWGARTEDFAPTMTYSRVFTSPGVYVYYCSIHGTPSAAMFGSVTVVAP